MSKNLVPLIEKICNQLNLKHRFIGSFFGQKVKRIEGILKKHKDFNYNKIYGMFKFIRDNNLNINIAEYILPHIYEHPSLEFKSVLTILKYKRRSIEDLLDAADFLYVKFQDIKHSDKSEAALNWLMGQIHYQAIGNCSLKELSEKIKMKIKKLQKPS